jgi:hypothetical protein
LGRLVTASPARTHAPRAVCSGTLRPGTKSATTYRQGDTKVRTDRTCTAQLREQTQLSVCFYMFLLFPGVRLGCELAGPCQPPRRSNPQLHLPSACCSCRHPGPLQISHRGAATHANLPARRGVAVPAPLTGPWQPLPAQACRVPRLARLTCACRPPPAHLTAWSLERPGTSNMIGQLACSVWRTLAQRALAPAGQHVQV